MAGALDINGRAAGNTADLSSRDGNDCAPEHSGTVGVAGALHINGRAASNAVSLLSKDMNIHFPKLSGTVSAAGALDINAERLATPPACRAGTRMAVRLSSSGRHMHFTSMVEWRATTATYD
jgi:hypothetical protein